MDNRIELEDEIESEYCIEYWVSNSHEWLEWPNQAKITNFAYAETALNTLGLEQPKIHFRLIEIEKTKTIVGAVFNNARQDISQYVSEPTVSMIPIFYVQSFDRTEWQIVHGPLPNYKSALQKTMEIASSFQYVRLIQLNDLGKVMGTVTTLMALENGALRDVNVEPFATPFLT